ncbi:MAG TPA: zf-HC2 domain-containing protein [Pyrinomonadaceae bacterium]|nr:zf-HC2 domain-containing protein [Pyrinomonadaceae bacterium]
MISCQDFITELGSLLDNDVAVEIREQLETHLAHCNTCQVLYDSTRKTLRIVTDSGSFEYAGPIEEPLVNKIMDRIRSGCELPPPPTSK